MIIKYDIDQTVKTHMPPPSHGDLNRTNGFHLYGLKVWILFPELIGIYDRQL